MADSKTRVEQIYDIPLSKIQVLDTNVRHTDADKNLAELAASIKKHGLLQPVVLRGEYGDPKHELIIGQRRYLAHKQLNKKTIKATFAGDLTSIEASIRSLAENMHRVELNHADAAEAVTALFKEYGGDERKVAKETGMSLQRVRQYIDIEERASNATKQKLRKGKVEPVDVQRVLKAAAGDIDKADALLEKMQEYQLTTHEKKRVVEYGEEHPRAGAETIIAEARRPRVERKMLLKLSDAARSGLETAAEALSMGPDEVAVQAVEDWLSAKGFLP